MKTLPGDIGQKRCHDRREVEADRNFRAQPSEQTQGIAENAEGKGEMTKPPFIVSRPWTPEEEDQLRTLAISGESIAAISKRLWRSEGALRHRARALGIVLRRVEKRE